MTTTPEQLAAEYRPTMTHDVLHAWAADAQATLRTLSTQHAAAVEIAAQYAAERDRLRAEFAALREQGTEIIVRQSILLGEYSKGLMPFDDDMTELIAIGKLVDALIPPPSPSSAEGA